jgi:WD40 repeat protein
MGTLEVSQTLASDESGSAIFQLAISPDGAYVVAGTSANTANVWHVASGAAIGELTGHTGNVNAVSMSSNGSNVATGSQDGTVLIWEDWSTEQPTALHGPLNHPAAVTDIAFSSDGRFVAAAGWDGTYRTWDVHSGEQAGPDVIHGQRGASVALSSAGTHILTGSDKTAALWRVSDGERLQTFEGHTDSVTGVGFTEDPRYVVTASKDAGIRVFERNTGALTLTYTLLGKGDWVAIDSNGFYDGSVGAFSQLYYATGLHTVTLDALFERYYRPGLIQMLWDGNVTSLASAASDAAILPPPEVEILSPSDGVHIAKKNTDVMVRVKDQGGGIGEVRLYHNGKHVGTGGHGTRTLQVAPPSVMTTTFDVELVDGTNVLRAIALSDDRIESHPDEIVVYASTADKVADLYLVTVGINEYQNARYSLNYARADAEGMADALIAGGSGIFGRINAQSIHNRDATRDRIMAALDNVIEHARPQDVFVFFYSGHGVVADGDASGGFYLVPTDVTQIYGDSNSLAQAGLPGDDLRDKFSKIAARKQVMFLDACYSGEFVDQSVAARGIREEKAIAQLSRSTGTAVIASTQSEQFAFEFAELGHGLFTYAILEGLRGMADGSPNNGVITISELSAYVQNRIPELSTEHRLQTQYPTVFIWGQDFPLATY